MPERRKLVLIDGFHTIFRAFYAIRELSNSRGEPTNAVYGFLQILRKILRDEKPDFLGVAWDVSDEATLRREKFADYKANRAPMPEELRAQVPQIERAIEAFRIPRLEIERYEADDVMGTLARKAAASGLDVVLVTADKDMFQLVGDGVRLLHTGRNKLYDAALVEEDFGVPPAQVADVLALMGDAVDNVPGVPGIGEKGARQLIREYGSVEALLEHAGELTRKAYREGLEQHRDQALLSKELTTIHTDLPIELHLESLTVDPPDTEALRQLYADLEFRGLLEELGATSNSGEEKLAVRELANATELEASAPAQGIIDVVLLPTESPVAVAFRAAGGEAALADLRRPGLAAAAAATVARWAGAAGVELVGHDLKELLRLAPHGTAVACGRFDLLLASYLLRTSSHGHPFEEIAFERLGVQPRTFKEAGFERGQVPELGDPRLAALAGERLDLVRRLEPGLRDELEASGAARVYREIEAPLTPLLLRMEETGIGLDVPFLAEMSSALERELVALEAEIYDLAGESFNIQSPQQLGVVLFEKLQLPAGRRTKKTKSWSTDADTLADLATQGHALPERILRFREIAKLKSTYVDALPTLVGADGRIHTRYQQAVAATGRLSSVNPNLQNIPIRTEQGQRIRRAFRASAGHLLVVADYSQIELRILAHIAGERTMQQAFAAGEDIHRATAAAMFGCAPDLVNSEQRRAAKTINFGLIYGMSAFGLARNLGISPKEAEQFIAAYFARYGGVQHYMQETLARAEAEGKVQTLWGRTRLLPELKHANYAVRENAKRVAINARIQGSAADLLKRAMLAVERRLRAEQPAAELLLTVHDELVLEAPEADAAAVADLVRAEMEGAAELDVPLVVDAGIGPTWGDAKS